MAGSNWCQHQAVSEINAWSELLFVGCMRLLFSSLYLHKNFHSPAAAWVLSMLAFWTMQPLGAPSIAVLTIVKHSKASDTFEVPFYAATSGSSVQRKSQVSLKDAAQSAGTCAILMQHAYLC